VAHGHPAQQRRGARGIAELDLRPDGHVVVGEGDRTGGIVTIAPGAHAAQRLTQRGADDRGSRAPMSGFRPDLCAGQR